MIEKEEDMRKEFNKRIKSLKLTEEAKEELFNMFSGIYNNGFRCTYCNERMGLKYGNTELAFTIDHILARVRGGSDNIQNLTFACQSCNSMKGDKDVEWFIKNVKRLKLRKQKREYGKARRSSKKDERTRDAFKDIFERLNAKNV